MHEALIPLLTFVTVSTFGSAVVLARAARRRPIQDRISQLIGEVPSKTPTVRSAWIQPLFRLGTLVIAAPSSALRAELASAGFHGNNAAIIYIGLKLLLLTAGLAVSAIILFPLGSMTLGVRVLLILCVGFGLFMLPNFLVRLQRHRRREEVRQHWPDALDLLEICVSSGMGLDLAWNSVADEIRGVCPTLADEMALANFEIHLNASRAVAMRHMAERTGVEDISSLVGLLVQSERFGTSIAEALRTFATSMREIRSQRAEEVAEKMPVKLLFPMILLVFPALLIVVAGPAVIRWIEILNK